jgi:hypothetical protein
MFAVVVRHNQAETPKEWGKELRRRKEREQVSRQQKAPRKKSNQECTLDAMSTVDNQGMQPQKVECYL